METKSSLYSYFSNNDGTDLRSIFDEYIDQQSIFLDKTPLLLNYTPSEVSHRSKEMKILAHILKPILKLEKPSNVFMFGLPGTGKTLVAKQVVKTLKDVADGKNIPLQTIYVNCRVGGLGNSDYRLLVKLCGLLGRELPRTGLSTKDIYDAFYNIVDAKKQAILLVLDEIDPLLTRKDSSFMYNISRIDEQLENAVVSFIGISNNVSLLNNVEKCISSTLSSEKIVFEPYNASQIYHIISKRAKLAFRQDSYTDSIIRLVSALTAKHSGDVREALNLLRVAGELAQRRSKPQITEEEVYDAEKKIKNDLLLSSVKSLTQNAKYILYIISSSSEDTLSVNDVYTKYKGIMLRLGKDPLTSRRIHDFINELETVGMLQSKVISMGRYGRFKTVCLPLEPSVKNEIKKMLEFELNL